MAKWSLGSLLLSRPRLLPLWPFFLTCHYVINLIKLLPTAALQTVSFSCVMNKVTLLLECHVAISVGSDDRIMHQALRTPSMKGCCLQWPFEQTRE